MISIVKATVKDVDEIVNIHLAAFENFFLSSLGEDFLKLYYTSFIKSGKGVVYCAQKNGELAGFSACSYISRGFNSFLIKKNCLRYGMEAFKLLFTKPKALERLVRNMDKEKDDTSISDEGLYAELYSIGVNPKYQGEGIGRRLLTETEKDVQEHNQQISLTTDYYNNEKTIAFYHSLGYKELYDFITYPNRRMLRMIKQLG